MNRTRPIDIFSAARVGGMVMALVGLAAGVLYSFGGLVPDTLVTLEAVTSSETPGLSFGTVLAFGALIGMPIIFAIPGLLLGAVGAYVYNAVVMWTDKAAQKRVSK